MCQQTAVAMGGDPASSCTPTLAEQVIADDAGIDELRVAAEEKAFGLPRSGRRWPRTCGW
jgi:hypothetical protein